MKHRSRNGYNRPGGYYSASTDHRRFSNSAGRHSGRRQPLRIGAASKDRGHVSGSSARDRQVDCRRQRGQQRDGKNKERRDDEAHRHRGVPDPERQAPDPDDLEREATHSGSEEQREGAREVGRDPSTIQFEGRVNYTPDDRDLMALHAERWREAGASHISLNTMGAGLQNVDAHINAISLFASQLMM